jgi:hypothetical protein
MSFPARVLQITSHSWRTSLLTATLKAVSAYHLHMGSGRTPQVAYLQLQFAADCLPFSAALLGYALKVLARRISLQVHY